MDNPRRHRRSTRTRPLIIALVGAVAFATFVATPAEATVPFEIQSLDGRGNNVANPDWGRAGNPYARVAAARYADGRSQPVSGPNSRYVSNRIHSDIAQNVFSQRSVTQWGFTWGQFLDHTFGLRLGRAPDDPDGEVANIPFSPGDPLEEFTNTLGVIPFERSAPVPGSGVSNARQQVNTNNSYISGFPVYGPDNTRLEWLRQGSVNGSVSDNSALLLLPGGYLPRANTRGNAATAPVMELNGRLLGNPGAAAVAGDVRANENIALTATHTLFAREHNRIVNALAGRGLSEEDKFQIARRIVIAEQQYITYTEFLPALGVPIPTYTGYRSNINTDLSNEFATVGYRAHSMIHGELEMETNVSRYSQATLDAFEAAGIEVAVDGEDAEIAVPLNIAFFNPDLVSQLQLGPLLQGIGLEAQYNNDEQIDNQLRSVLFQVPVSGNPECLDGPTLPECFQGVVDLGAIDIERGRDHGMPTYNQLRQAYGLPARTSFTQITGESSASFPPGTGVDNPNSIEFTRLVDIFGVQFPVAEDRDPVIATRRSPMAARLQAIYGNVNNVDAFVGMLAEPHLPGSDMGELQRAIWAREFTRLRDGDRFFYGNQAAALDYIRTTYGIDYRRNLGDIIAANTDIPRAELASNVFFTEGNVPPTSCRVQYVVNSQWGTGSGGFNTTIRITNTGTTPIPGGWTLRFVFANGQQVYDNWNSVIVQDEGRVPVASVSANAAIAPGQTRDGIGFNATWTATNARPSTFTLNTTTCSVA